MNIVGTNVISALGFSNNENFENIKNGVSGLKYYPKELFSLPEPFVASLIDKDRLDAEFHQLLSCKYRYKQNLSEGLTQLEKASILSVAYSNNEAEIDLSSQKTIFILSTTKGNIHLINSNKEKHKAFLWHSAQQIVNFFYNRNTPIVVSNACISGAAAQIVAMRELQNGKFENAVVIGVDFLSKFIISGFMSFKALSSDKCKSFDKNRAGLNLGEAAGSIILQQRRERASTYSQIKAGAIYNDATHISAPSRQGEGYLRALNKILTDNKNICFDDIGFINAHGTATPYNDSMESVAIIRAGLKNTPVNSLKGYFGHTLGAAGVIETIISLEALKKGIVLPTLNITEVEQVDINGELLSLNIVKKQLQTSKKYMIKTLSGFGGVNAALLIKK